MKFAKLLACLLFAISSLSAQESETITTDNSDKYREFDFWTGEWDVNLRQKQFENGWKDWKSSKAKIYKILDGRAILELWEEQGDLAPANTIIGYSLRYYDADQNKWVLWLNWPGVNRSGSSSLTGEFRHGRGEFFSERALNDSTSLISRYSFSDITANSLRWDDAFSRDGGTTWTNNWIMEFTRTDQQNALPTGDELHTFRNGNRCQGDPFKKLEVFVGDWLGTAEINSEEKKGNTSIRIKNYKSLGNCSVMSFMEIGTKEDASFKEFGLLTYNSFAKKYEDGRLSNDYSGSYRAYYGGFSNDNTLKLDKLDEAGNPSETYFWILENPDNLQLEKWNYENGKKTLVFSGKLTKK